MNIPKNFKIAGFDVNVEFINKTDDNNYGYWDDVNNKIVIATNISLKTGELTEITTRQKIHTFWHEVGHAFQFYSGKAYDETEATTFANFMLEFNETKTE